MSPGIVISVLGTESLQTCGLPIVDTLGGPMQVPLSSPLMTLEDGGQGLEGIRDQELLQSFLSWSLQGG